MLGDDDTDCDTDGDAVKLGPALAENLTEAVESGESVGLSVADDDGEPLIDGLSEGIALCE